MINNPHIIQQLANQHLADLRLEAERERMGRRDRGQQRRARRQAARWMRLSNVKSASREEVGWRGLSAITEREVR